MEKNKVDMFMVQHHDQFAATDLPRVRKALEAMPDSEFLRLATLDLKSPTMTLVLALALGGYGVGAFYVKKIGFGIAQVAICVVYFIIAILVSVLGELAGNDDELFGIMMFFLALFFILTVVMIVLVIISAVKARKWTEEYNINKFNEMVRY